MQRLCPICSSAENNHLYKQVFGNKSVAIMEWYDVIACKKCGFIFADNIPDQEEFSRYYAEMSKYEFNYNGGVVSEDYISHFQKIVDFIIPSISNKKVKIIDIGCSTGCLLSLLKKNGYMNLLGVDPSLFCANTVRSLYGIESIASDIFHFEPNEKFDLVILSAVLEHFIDLDGALEKIYAILKEDGLLFVEVPDAARFNEYIYTPFQQFSIEHINYFSKVSTANLLSKFFFDIIKIENNENKVNQTIDPDIFILSKKVNRDENRRVIVKDRICEDNLKDYIVKCAKIDADVNAIIRNKLAHVDKFIIWGVGTHTQRLIGAGLDLSKVLYFVDSNARYRGKKIKGVEIKSPVEIKDSAPVLISTFSYQEEIIRQIRDVLKINNEIIKIY